MSLSVFEFFGQWTIYQKLTFIFLVITSLFSVSMALKKLYDWYKRRKEKTEYNKIMEDPLEARFFIPTLKDHKITYAKQNNEIHLQDELEIPEDTEDIIFLRIRPRINAKVWDRYFGFLIKEIREKPEISYSNVFARESSFDRDWYKDMYGHLHFPKEQIWYRDENYISTLKIKTHEKGDYPFYMYCTLSSNEYKSVKEERHTVSQKTLTIKVRQKNVNHDK